MENLEEIKVLNEDLLDGSDSFEVSFLLASTAIPIDLANATLLRPTSWSSLTVNPLPSLIFPLYLLVCPLTAGLNR